MIRIEISEACDRLEGVLMQDGRDDRTFSGWLQMVALVEVARCRPIQSDDTKSGQ